MYAREERKTKTSKYSTIHILKTVCNLSADADHTSRHVKVMNKFKANNNSSEKKSVFIEYNMLPKYVWQVEIEVSENWHSNVHANVHEQLDKLRDLFSISNVSWYQWVFIFACLYGRQTNEQKKKKKITRRREKKQPHKPVSVSFTVYIKVFSNCLPSVLVAPTGCLVPVNSFTQFDHIFTASFEWQRWNKQRHTLLSKLA